MADFWFIRGVGSIKETVTQRSPGGDLLSRNTIELVKLPTQHQPEPTKKLEASVSTSSNGDPLSVISADALQIVARWRGHGLRKNARVRAVWIAEDTGIGYQTIIKDILHEGLQRLGASLPSRAQDAE